ncbi:MAG: SDR family oxidoreductase [Ferruginibacter sp.]
MNVVITGGSKGIGKAIALRYASAGNNLFLCARNADKLQEAASEIQKQYPAVKIKIKAVDLSDKNQVLAFADWCLHHAVPDIIVNNAGVYFPGNTIDEPENSLETMMNSNLYSAYHLTRKLVPAMIKKGSGHIFNMCSVASLQAYNGGGGYSISKFALWGFTQNLRHELKAHNIKVTAVFPGAVLTESWAGFDNSSNRIMVPHDVAEMIFAASTLSPQSVVEDIILRPQLGDLN